MIKEKKIVIFDKDSVALKDLMILRFHTTSEGNPGYTVLAIVQTVKEKLIEYSTLHELMDGIEHTYHELFPDHYGVEYSFQCYDINSPDDLWDDLKFSSEYKDESQDTVITPELILEQLEELPAKEVLEVAGSIGKIKEEILEEKEEYPEVIPEVIPDVDGEDIDDGWG